MLEDATNQGHNALSHYRKYGGKWNLERSVEHFKRALGVCPLNHPCRAAAQSNLANVTFILCQIENVDALVPLGLYRNALAARPVGHIDRPSTLIQLAAVHLERSKKSRGRVERTRAERLLHEAMKLSPVASHEKQAASFMLRLHAGHSAEAVKQDSQSPPESQSTSPLEDADIQILDRILNQRLSDPFHLQQAITVWKKLVRSVPTSHDLYHMGIKVLGEALLLRFDQLGQPSDLEDAISTFKGAVDVTPRGHPSKPAYLAGLGDSFFARFERFGELSDLEDAISRQRDSVNLTPRGHPDKPDRLGNLGHSLRTRFERLGELSDLEDAISILREAVDLTHKPAYLNNLGISLLVRFKRLGDLRDLENAMSTLRDAVDLTPHDDPKKPVRLNSLGSCFTTRFERLGERADLENAILTLKDAVDLASHGHPDNPDCLINLGYSFFTRFEHFGELKDLEDAISAQRLALCLAPHGHRCHTTCLCNLGIYLRNRFERLGEPSNLEGSISMLRNAVDLTPQGHPDKSAYLDRLGASISIRFLRSRELNDLDDAILAHADAVNLTFHGHPDKATRLNNLGTALFARFERLGELSDLESAISRQREAVNLTPSDRLYKPAYLNNLGTFLRTRFERLGELSDLEDAISSLRDTVDLTPLGHPRRPGRLSNLGRSFHIRSKHLEEPSDLEHVISMFMDAVDLTPHGHPDEVVHLTNLGNSLETRFEQIGELRDMEHAIFLYSRAASIPFGPARGTFHASQKWISCARRMHHRSLLHAYLVSVNLLPQLAWIGLSLTQRYTEIVRAADVVREAAATALDLGFPETAVEWLEKGRTIVWGQLIQLRGLHDGEELSAAYPDHARRLEELSTELGHASAAREKVLTTRWERVQNTGESLPQAVDRHRMLAIERDKLLQEIRKLPGFEQFLLHKDFSQLRASAHAGPVVILNAAESRCDALIVLADVDHVIHVPLPNFTFKRSADLQNILKSFVRDAREGRRATWDSGCWESFLSPLWQCVVKPVLDALAFSVRDVVSVDFTADSFI